MIPHENGGDPGTGNPGEINPGDPGERCCYGEVSQKFLALKFKRTALLQTP